MEEKILEEVEVIDSTIYVYNYDSVTKEYINKEVAEQDKEMSRIKNMFIPLVPANATLKEPPEFTENQIPVYSKDRWTIFPDYRKNFLKSDENLNITPIISIGEQDGYILDKELAKEVQENPGKFKISDDKIIKKTKKEIEDEQKQAERERIAKLSLTKREVFLALYRSKGLTPDMVRSQITDTEALIEFDYATEYYRFNPLIDKIGAMLGYTSKNLDYLFINGEFPQDKDNTER